MKLLSAAAIAALSVASSAPGVWGVEASAVTWKGDFQLRWSAAVDGDLIALEIGADRLYLAEQDGSNLHVASFKIDDGTELWRRTLTTTFMEDRGYWSRATDRGYLLTFDDADSGHLVLLDADTGEPHWDEMLDSGAYDVAGQLNEHVALIYIRETELEFVDLDTGERMSAGELFTDDWR